MGTLWQDLRYGLRMLLRAQGFTTVAVVTLALGIGANTAIFSVVNALLLRPLQFRDPDRLVMVWGTHPQFPKLSVPYPVFLDWKEQNQVFEQLGCYRWAERSYHLTGQGEPERLRATFADAGFFSILGIEAFIGRTFLPAEHQLGGERVVMLSYSLWQRRFGANPNLIGKTIVLNNEGFSVVGIMPSGFQVPTWADLWMPVALNYAGERTSREFRPFAVIARLKQGVTLTGAQAQMNAITERIEIAHPKWQKGWGVHVMPLHDDLLGTYPSTLLILLGAVGLVLLITCANVANLLLQRAAARQKEIAVRTALGAGRLRLLRQLLTESLLLSVLGGGLGILLACWGLRFLLALGPTDIPRKEEIGVDAAVLSFAMLLSVFTGLAFGLIPAFLSTGANLHGGLKEGVRNSTGGWRTSQFRNWLTISELSLALVLLLSACLLIRSFANVLDADPGFKSDKVLTLKIDLPERKYAEPWRIESFYEQVYQRIKALPGVLAVGAVNYLPLAGDITNRQEFAIEGRPLVSPGMFDYSELRSINFDYLRAMGIPVLRGRQFTERDWAEAPLTLDDWMKTSHPALINQSMARQCWPNQDAIGKRINIAPAGPNAIWLAIVGVVADVSQFGLDASPTFDIYLPGSQSTMVLVVKTHSDPTSVAAAARTEIRAVDKDVPVSKIQAMEQFLSDSVSPRRFSTLLLSIFAAVALLVATVGIYGVVSYSVSWRNREIGIRMALGAQRSDVLKLVLWHGVKLAVTGVVIGLVVAVPLTRLLSSSLYGVSATDPATFVGISMLLTAVALLACYIPARRSMKVDPMVALRYE